MRDAQRGEKYKRIVPKGSIQHIRCLDNIVLARDIVRYYKGTISF